MAVIREKIEFPCGLKYEGYIKGLGVNGQIGLDQIKECPLHGKKCSIKK